MNILAQERAKKMSEICRVFGHVSRILILWELAEQEKSVGEIAAAIDSSVQCTSQHLRLMKDKGILETRREGQSIYYRVEQEELFLNCQHILQARTQDDIQAV